MPTTTSLPDQYSNRLMDSLLLYAQQEAQFKMSSPYGNGWNNQADYLKLEYYTSVHNAFKKKKRNRMEKRSMRFIKSEIARLKAKQHPTLIKRIWYAKPIHKLRHFLKGNSHNFTIHNLNIERVQQDNIQEYNVLNLSSALKASGFNQNVDGVLEKMVSQGLDKFHFRYTDVANPNTDFTLHFRKAPNSEIYFFEKFQANARPSIHQFLSNREPMLQKEFTLHDKIRFSAREAANLVNGKSIYKMNDGTGEWLTLNPTSYSTRGTLENTSFNLEKELEKLPVKNWENVQYRSNVMDALKGGNKKEVIIAVNGVLAKYHLEAIPRQKTIKVTDRFGEIVSPDKMARQGVNEKAKAVALAAEQKASTVIDLASRQRASF